VQAIVDLGLGDAARGQRLDNGALAVGHRSAIESPELTSVPSPAYASASGVVAVAPGAAITRTIGNPNRCANSKSRSSWPGTAMIAPVP
jgi:hypothetical protein